MGLNLDAYILLCLYKKLNSHMFIIKKFWTALSRITSVKIILTNIYKSFISYKVILKAYSNIIKYNKHCDLAQHLAFISNWKG